MKFKRYIKSTIICGAIVVAAAISVGLLLFCNENRSFRIVEGPLVQLASESGVTLVWSGSEEIANDVRISVEGDERLETVTPAGLRYRLRLDGLTAGRHYEYSISAAETELFRGRFLTNKTNREAFRILVFGDSGTGGRRQYQLADEFPQVKPDLVLHTGDVVYEHGERDGYEKRFFEPYAELISGVNLWPTLGNHDMHPPGNGKPYRDVFELPLNGPAGLIPEEHYWFDYSSARIAVINSTSPDRETNLRAIAPWLEQVFASSQSTWRFVLSHYCPYSVDHDRPVLKEQLVPLFERLDIDVVFCGHDHFYMRTPLMKQGAISDDGSGVVYIVSGAAGALGNATYDPLRHAFVAVIEDESYSYTIVDVDNSTLRLRQIARGGREIDRWGKSR